MDVQNDFNELLELFNKHAVEYVIVGAYALAYHGVPRYTGDLDILVRADQDNATRVLAALDAIGFGSLGLRIDDFATQGNVVQLGVPPVRVDILTSISGVSWDDVWNGREQARYGDVAVSFIGRDQYIANKRAIGRKKDLADLEALDED